MNKKPQSENRNIVPVLLSESDARKITEIICNSEFYHSFKTELAKGIGDNWQIIIPTANGDINCPIRLCPWCGEGFIEGGGCLDE